jgi:hypothetical protein
MFRKQFSRNDRHLMAAVVVILLLIVTGFAQSTGKKPKLGGQTAQTAANAVMWEPVAEPRDTFWGPGGKEMAPDLSTITFVKQEKGGHNKKYRIKDGSGRTWIAKLGREARPETAAVRILYGLGYKTEINYLVPRITIPTKGTFTNVRLELRPDNVDRTGSWKWRNNPFVESPELQALKIMQIFMTNWDVLDIQNEILKVETPNGVEHHYIISDLGRTFGKYGNNNLPIFYRLGRRTGDPKSWSKASFVKGIDKKGRIKWGIKGKNRGIYKDITVADAAWLLGHLKTLSDQQVTDAFRAASYSPAEIDMYFKAFKRRISELDRLVTDNRLAGR